MRCNHCENAPCVEICPTQALFTRPDGIVDFDEALRDPERPTQMLPIYDCGDGLHPSDLGYCSMGDAIDLTLFD